MSPSPSTYATIDLSTYNNRSNATDANTAASNSNPHSTIKVTSIDQPAMSSYSQLQSSQYAALQSSENHISRLSNSVGNYYGISNLIVNAGTSVILNGDSSHDPDGDPIGFKWEQISGPRVTLNGDNTSRATFIAPNVYSNTTILFKLTVTDQNGLSDSKTVQITVIQQAV
jgi:K319-like protein